MLCDEDATVDCVSFGGSISKIGGSQDCVAEGGDHKLLSV
jgi:hypothetical protein